MSRVDNGARHRRCAQNHIGTGKRKRERLVSLAAILIHGCDLDSDRALTGGQRHRPAAFTEICSIGPGKLPIDYDLLAGIAQTVDVERGRCPFLKRQVAGEKIDQFRGCRRGPTAVLSCFIGIANDRGREIGNTVRDAEACSIVRATIVWREPQI